MIWPFPGITFCLWAFDMLNISTVFWMLPIAATLSAIFYYTQKDLKEKELPR